MKSILCFGDSNTYGAVANGGRYGRYERWPGHLQQLLGSDYYVIEEGCNGRTTLWDDPIEEHKNGKAYLLPCMYSHKPVDLIVLMLGTNDLKNRFSLTATDIAWSIDNLINTIQTSNNGPDESAPQILLISPPEVTTLSDAIAGVLVGAREKREALAPLLAALAKTKIGRAHV